MKPLVHRLLPPILAAACVLRTAAASGEPMPGPGPQVDLLTAASNPLLVEAFYRKPSRLVSGVNPDGAVSVNGDWERHTRPDWFIEQQRYGGDLVQAGVVLKDNELIRQGIKILAWGFARQAADGSFPGTGDPLHSVELFVEGASRAALLLQEAKMQEFEPFVAEITPKLRLAGLWMISPEVALPGREKNLTPFMHRYFIRAAALAQTGRLTGDARLSEAAAALAREGAARQQPDGVDPERGGFDVSYQAVGLLMAGRYEASCADPALRAEVQKVIVRAWDYELTKIDPAGHVDLEGSTRVTKEPGRSGKPKTFDYKALAQAAVFATALTGDARYTDAARRALVACGWLPAGAAAAPSPAGTAVP